MTFIRVSKLLMSHLIRIASARSLCSCCCDWSAIAPIGRTGTPKAGGRPGGSPLRCRLSNACRCTCATWASTSKGARHAPPSDFLRQPETTVSTNDVRAVAIGLLTSLPPASDAAATAAVDQIKKNSPKRNRRRRGPTLGPDSARPPS